MAILQLHERIRIARTKAGLKQQEVANLFTISRNAVSLWETSKEKGGNAPTADKLGIIARETQVRAEWLISGTGPMDGDAPNTMLEPVDSSGRSTMQSTGSIPVMGTAEGGPDGLMEWNGEEIDRKPRPPFLADAKGAYALYVTGTSMEPRYHASEMIYVHPGKPIVPGAYVVVQFHKDEGGGMPYVWVKQFVERASKITTFLQFNPRKELKLPTKSILAIHRIVGSGEM